MIELHETRFGYPMGEFELRIPELRVAPRERVAVVGPSGSGKTTLLHLIAGIELALGGSVRTAGVDVGALDPSERRDFRIRRLGLVFQEFELLEYLSVLDNIMLPYRISPALRLDAQVRERERARALLDRVGIGELAARGALRLSQGEKQRVAVCRALIASPELLLADEPTGNLDAPNRDRVLEILLDYASERGATLVLVTHDRDLLSRFDRVIDLKALGS